mmetsp:Transcript_29132/g.52107  ORF Transcript_29132/g.52107 Transcript_29132/m.52107 type:complete len:172 (+) Transcript_29132:105-620(+)
MRTRSISNLAYFKQEPHTLQEEEEYLTPCKRRASDSLNLKDSSTIGSPSEFDFDVNDKGASRKRFRKTAAQVKILKTEYNANPAWSKETYAELAARTGLSESQVYKWSWDYRKKLRSHVPKESLVFLYCNETLSPSPLDTAMYAVQRAYKGALLAVHTKYSEFRSYEVLSC